MMYPSKSSFHREAPQRILLLSQYCICILSKPYGPSKPRALRKGLLSLFSDADFEPSNSHNLCKFVVALRIQGITPPFGHDSLVYNVLFDPYENARTAGICGRIGGGHAPSPFFCFSFVGFPLP